MKKRRWFFPDWAYIPIAIFNIFMIFVYACIVVVIGTIGYKYISDYPDSVWYCEETNMRATVIVPGDDVDYISIVDLDNGEKYSVTVSVQMGNHLYQGDIRSNVFPRKVKRCRCGFSMEERRFVQKIKSFTLNTAENCTHLPCDGSITFVRMKNGKK